MATLSSPDLTLLRTNINRVTPYLSVLQPTALLSGLVNGSFSRGARSIDFDNGTGTGFSTIEAGQTFEIITSDGRQRSRVKSISGSQSSGSISLDENGIVWENNAQIFIYHNYEIVPIPPVIRSQIFYKFYDLVFSDQTINPPPVAIAGPHRAGFLSAGSIVFTLDATPSYVIADGAAITDYTWSCVHMGGGTSGITIADAADPTTTLTITQAGQYWLKLTVEDDNGNTQNTYRAIFVYDTSTLPYRDFSIQSLTGDWSSGGWRATIVPFGDVELSDFPDRTLCLLWYVSYFNASNTFVDLWDINADNVILGGYIRQDNDTDQFTDGTGSVSFDVTTPESVIDNISELGSVSLNAVSSPSTWYEYADWMTTGRAVHHLIKYHSYGVLQCWDVLGLDEDSRGVLNTDFTEGSLLQQINGLAFNRGIYAKLACDRFGRLHLVKDSNILNDAGRGALDTVMTITEADVSGVVTLVRDPEEQIAFGELNGFSFDGADSTPFISILPGYRESSISYIMPNLRGSGTLSVGNQILSSQTDSNERIGRVLAQANNNPRELRYTTPYNGLGAFDIINSIGWYVWGMADDDLKRNTELNGRQLICRSITHTFNHLAGTVQTELAFEPEAFGPDGIQGNYPLGYPATTPPEPDWTPPNETPAQYSLLAYLDDTDSKGYACIVTNSPLSVGTPVEIAAVVDGYGYGLIAVLDETHAVIVWDNGNFVGKILTISGGAITNIGALNTISSICPQGNPNWGVWAISSTQAIIVTEDRSGGLPYPASTFVIDIDVGGDTITAGADVDLDANDQPRSVAISRLSSVKAIASYYASADLGKGKAVILDVSGSTITPGTLTQFNANISSNGLAVIDSTTAICFFGDAGSGNYEPTAKPLYSISGTTFSQGSENTLDAAADINTFYPGHRIITSLDSERVVVSWLDINTQEQFLCCVEYTGGSVAGGTPLSIDTLLSPHDEYPQISNVGNTKVIAVFVQDDPAPLGRIMTATINEDLSITNNGNEVSISANQISHLDIMALRNIT